MSLFFLGWVFMYANRTVLSPLLEPLGTLWSLNETQLGLITSAFFLTYTLLQVPFGWLAEKVGLKKQLVPGYLLHGIGAAASGLAPGPGAFLAFRVFTGATQASYFSPQYALASRSIPVPRRGFGMAIINSGMAFGMSLGLIMSGTLVYSLGLSWRAPFVALGALTLIVGALFGLVIREGKAAAVADGAPSPAPTAPPASPYYRRNLLAASGAAFFTMYSFYVILTWLPYYLQTVRGYSGSLAGNISTLMAFTSVPGGLFYGRLSDRLGLRKPIAMILIPISAVALAAIVAPLSPALLAAVLIIYGLTGKLVIDPLYMAIIADVTPPERYASAFGALNFAATASMVLAPAITGFIAHQTGSFVVAFYVAAATSVLGAITLSFAREKRTAATVPRA
ncbi:MAG TPA: MFS transporter [Bacillota bacterium]